MGQLDEVVEEADRSTRERREEHSQRLQAVVADRQEGYGRREQDQQAAHRRRPLLVEVMLRAFLPDVLAELVAPQELDEPRSDHEREGERDGGGDENADHGRGSSSASATTSSPTEREPLTRIASPGRTSSRAIPRAWVAEPAHSSGP